jgi:hypothetical protein
VSLIIEHLEFLIRRHDCVTVPGIGAVMVRYKSASFDENNPMILLPPSRELAFNGGLVQSDGVLESSVARKNGISFEAARRMVAEEAESLLHQLKTFGELALGHLGVLQVTEYGSVVFNPASTAAWDSRYFGLRKLQLTPAEAQPAPVQQPAVAAVAPATPAAKPAAKFPEITPWTPEQEEVKPVGGWKRSIVGIAASLAVIITTTLFFWNPIKMDNEPMKASLAPSERVEASRNDNAAVNTSAIPAAVASESASQKATPATAPASSQNDAVQTVTAPANNVATEAVAAPDASATAAKASASAPAASTAAAKPTIHFNEGDAFCVIIASFPDADQASVYLKEHSSKSLGVLQQDGKYRVYAATGATYEEATTQKSIVGNGAWICRR